jgi:hypothetical protein
MTDALTLIRSRLKQTGASQAEISTLESFVSALLAIKAIGSSPDPKWDASSRCDAMWLEAKTALERAAALSKHKPSE